MFYVVERPRGWVLKRLHVFADEDVAQAFADGIGEMITDRLAAEQFAFGGAEIVCDGTGGEIEREVERLDSFMRCHDAIDVLCADVDVQLAWVATMKAMAAWGDRSRGDVYTARVGYAGGRTSEPEEYDDVPMLAVRMYGVVARTMDTRFDCVGAFIDD